MALIIKKDESLITLDPDNIFYPGKETNFYCYLDHIRVAWCEGAIRQKINSEMSYFLSVIETKKEYRKKGYSREILRHIYNKLNLPITPINVNNQAYWKYLYSCNENKFIIEAPLCEKELKKHKKFWRNNK